MKEFEEGIKRGTKGGKIALFLGILVVVLGVLAAYLGTTFYSRRMDDFNAALELTGKERAAALRKVLSESWWSDVRTEAAYELGELRDKEAVPLLIEAVKASDTFLKRTAAEALAKIGDTRQEVLDAIYEQVLEAEGTEQFELAWSLGRLEDKRALPPLLDAYLRGDHKEFEDFDEGIIAELGGLPELKKLLTHKDPAVRMFAAQYIGPIGGKEAVDALIPVLNDPKPQVVIAAAASLCQCDDPRVQPKIIELIKNRPQLMPQLVAAMNIYVGAPGLGALLKATDDLKIHNEVMVHLQNLRDPRGADILTEYIENSPSDPQKRTFQGVDLRKVAIWALSDLGDQRAVPYLIARLSEDDVDKVREVIDVIGKLKDPRAVEPLTTLMASNPFYRAPVIMALARYRDPSLAPLIAPHLKSEDSQTAALALGMTGNTKYTKDLIEMSKNLKKKKKRSGR
jgi:HEAT repeat protein